MCLCGCDHERAACTASNYDIEQTANIKLLDTKSESKQQGVKRKSETEHRAQGPQSTDRRAKTRDLAESKQHRRAESEIKQSTADIREKKLTTEQIA
jgi:hypothetical protein